MRSNEPPIGGVVAFDDTNSLATWLHDAGYYTAHVGKYLNGYGRSDLTGDGVVDLEDARYVPPGWDHWQGLVDPSTYRVYNYTINDNGALVHYGTGAENYQTDVLAARARRVIEKVDRARPGAPLFLAVTPLAPHIEVLPGISFDEYSDAWRWTSRPAPRHAGSVALPLPRPPSFNERNVSDKPAWLQQRPRLTARDIGYLTRQYRDRLASVRAVDDLVGTVIAALRQTGKLDNTVIIFTSDNGFLYGEHRLPEKLYAYEEAIRVPLLIRAPGIPGPQVVGQIALNNDLAPTIAHFAGVTPGRAVDGRSLIPLLADPQLARWRLRFLVEHWQAGPSIFEVPTFAAVRAGAASRATPEQLYVEWEDGVPSRELYDLPADPYQLRSLHEDPSPLRVRQRAILAAWLAALRTCGSGLCQVLEFDERE